MRPVWWGYRPHWAVARKIPQMINARADKIESATWKPMLKAGRVIVPVDCWYEWIKDEDGKKTAISPTTERPSASVSRGADECEGRSRFRDAIA